MSLLSGNGFINTTYSAGNGALTLPGTNRGDPIRLGALQAMLGYDRGLAAYDAWTAEQIDAFLASQGAGGPQLFAPSGGPMMANAGSPLMLGSGAPASFSWGGVGDVLGKIGRGITDVLGIFGGGSGGGMSPTFPSFPFPGSAGPAGPFPTGPTFPGPGGPPALPGPETMGMGTTIGKIGGAIARSGLVRTVARNVVPAIVAGVVGEWVYDRLRGWFFRKKRHRHMNVLNPHALKRATKREHGFKKVAQKTLRELGYQVHRTGYGTRSRSRSHRPGCGCVVCKSR